MFHDALVSFAERRAIFMTLREHNVRFIMMKWIKNHSWRWLEIGKCIVKVGMVKAVSIAKIGIATEMRCFRGLVE